MFNTNVVNLKNDIATILNKSQLPLSVKQMILKESLGEITVILNRQLIVEKEQIKQQEAGEKDAETLS